MPLDIDQFENVLKKLVDELNTYERATLKKLTASDFELKTYEILSRMVNGLSKNINVDYKMGSTTFPDIAVENFGVEIKTTEADKWECIGNSIIEGTRRNSIKKIYIIFLKKGGVPSVRWAPYENSVSDIKVTHSPRYYVDLDSRESIFARLGMTYEDFQTESTSEKISVLKNYYKRKNQESWWIDPDAGEQISSFEFIEWGSLDAIKKKKLRVECFSFFPEILKPGAGDFSGVSTYLLVRYNCLNRSVRDAFTAGGRQTVRIRNEIYDLSRAHFNFYELRTDIRRFIVDNSLAVKTHFGFKKNDDAYIAWLAYLDRLKIVIPGSTRAQSLTIRELFTS